MKKIAESVLAVVCKDLKSIKDAMCMNSGDVEIYPASVHKIGDAAVMMGRNSEERFLMVVAYSDKTMPAGFAGEKLAIADGGAALVGKLDSTNAAALRQYFPWCAPKSLRNVKTTVGCGDRLGLATPGHVAAAVKFQVSPVIAQQSMRELSMTNRTFRSVVDDTVFGVFKSDYQLGWGADGDHLKTIPDIDVALEAGMPMITLDLSEVMNAAAGDWEDGKVDAAFAEMAADFKKRIADE